MDISKDDIVERNVRITNNNVIDMHVGKRVRSSPRWISRGDNADVLNGERIKDPMARRETLELVRTYYTIEKPAVRKRIAEMVKSIATTLAGE